MLNVFIGYEPRQPWAYNVLQFSIARHSSVPVAISPLMLHQLPIKRRGLTEFTYSRFLVPWLCDYMGTAVFMDADMVVKGDIKELFDHATPRGPAVFVVKDQPKFEWASMMLFNNHACTRLTPEFVEDQKNAMFDMAWADEVGELPAEWNHCVGLKEPRKAKLYHYTQGLPCWHETKGLAEDSEWLEEAQMLTKTVSWKDLMGTSVHAKPVLERLMKRLTA